MRNKCCQLGFPAPPRLSYHLSSLCHCCSCCSQRWFRWLQHLILLHMIVLVKPVIISSSTKGLHTVFRSKCKSSFSATDSPQILSLFQVSWGLGYLVKLPPTLKDFQGKSSCGLNLAWRHACLTCLVFQKMWTTCWYVKFRKFICINSYSSQKSGELAIWANKATNVGSTFPKSRLSSAHHNRRAPLSYILLPHLNLHPIWSWGRSFQPPK